MNPQMQVQEGERALAHIWKATAVRGLLAIAFAVVILIWPNIGLTALIALFGAYALVSGLTTIAGAFSAPIRTGWRAWLVFEGLLGIWDCCTPSPRGRSPSASSRSPSRSPCRSTVDGRCCSC